MRDIFPQSLLAGAGSSLGQHPLVGTWVLHIYLRDGRGMPVLFDDKLTITQTLGGALTGEITVPDRFTAKLRTVRVNGPKVYFDIVADERGNKIEVKYEGELHKDGRTFVGYAHVLPTNELVGGFVAQRLPLTRI